MRPIVETFRISDADYPDEAKRNGVEGVTNMLITVGTDGRISACTIRWSSGSLLLDERSCAIAVERFRFTPATRGGEPVESKAVLPLAWKLEQEPPAPENAPR